MSGIKWPTWGEALIRQQAEADRIQRERQRDQDVLAALHSIVSELNTARQHQDTADAEKQTREHKTIVGLFVTAGIALLAFLLGVYQTQLTLRAIKDAQTNAAQQHFDTLEALKIADTANSIAKTTASDQLRAMQNQIDEMQRQSALAVNQSIPKMELSFTSPEGSVSKNGVSGRFITPVWQNHGSTEAIDFWAWASNAYFEPDAPLNFDWFRGTSPATKTTVGPNETRSLISRFVSDYEIESAIAGHGKLIIWGEIRYRESLPGHQSHKVNWCSYISPAKTANGYQFSFHAYQQICSKRT